MDYDTHAWGERSTRMLTLYPRHRSEYVLRRNKETSSSCSTLSHKPLAASVNYRSKQYNNTIKQNDNINNINILDKGNVVVMGSNNNSSNTFRASPADSHLSRCAAGEFVTITNAFDENSWQNKRTIRRKSHSAGQNKEYNRSNTSQHPITKKGIKCMERNEESEQICEESEQELKSDEKLYKMLRTMKRPLSAVSVLRPASSYRRVVSSNHWRFITSETRLEQQMCRTHIHGKEKMCNVTSELEKNNEFQSSHELYRKTEKNVCTSTDTHAVKADCVSSGREEEKQVELESHYHHHHVNDNSHITSNITQIMEEWLSKEQEKNDLITPCEYLETIIKPSPTNKSRIAERKLNLNNNNITNKTEKNNGNKESCENIYQTFKHELTNAADKLDYNDVERRQLLELSSVLREIRLRDYFLQHHPLRSMTTREAYRICSLRNNSAAEINLRLTLKQ